MLVLLLSVLPEQLTIVYKLLVLFRTIANVFHTIENLVF